MTQKTAFEVGRFGEPMISSLNLQKPFDVSTQFHMGSSLLVLCCNVCLHPRVACVVGGRDEKRQDGNGALEIGGCF